MRSNGHYTKELIGRVKNVFKHNTIEGYSSWKKIRYKYIAPAMREYKFQWLWDTAFIAIVLSHFDTERAKSEIRMFLHGQWKNGFIPHVVFWGDYRILPFWAYTESKLSLWPKTTAITQPPMFPLAVEAIYKKDSDKNFLREVLPRLARHFRWLIKNRDEDKDHLLSIISPNESGMDELPVFQYAVGFFEEDAVRLHYAYRMVDISNLRYGYKTKLILEKDYFNVREVLFNVVYVENAKALARLFAEIKQISESNFFLKAANLCEHEILTQCWNSKDKLFYSLYTKEGRQAKVKTIASLIPLFLSGIKKDQVKALIKHLLDPKEFWTKYPVPTVAKSERYYHPTASPLFRGKLLWRGPTWINTNWFIVKGLRKHGYDDIADEIVVKTIEMVDKHGFREFYNPETGTGYRWRNFAWSTLILDLL